MTQKFGRAYRIEIDLNDGTPPIVVRMPLTVEFSVKRNTLQSLNYMTMDIYNLSQRNRDRIFQDRFAPRLSKITFEAGYDNLSTIFFGNVFEAGTFREGNDIITRIEAKDGSFNALSTQTYQTINKGQSVKNVLETLIGNFPDLERGVVGNYLDVLRRPVVLNGNTYELLKRYSNNDVFIDNNRVYSLQETEAIEGGVPIIRTETGLLETPKRNDGFISVPTIFEPRIIVGQIIDLESAIQPVYNGQYKVVGIDHRGIISEAKGGVCRSTFDLFIGSNVFEVVG